MEQSPLMIAQNHARNAATAPNPAAAEVEHEQAAAHFAAAAKGTTNQEASRTLKLLEEHHRKLADLLKFRLAHPIPPETPNTAEQPLPAYTIPPAPQQPREGSPYRSHLHPFLYSQQPRLSSRYPLKPPKTFSTSASDCKARSSQPTEALKIDRRHLPEPESATTKAPANSFKRQQLYTSFPPINNYLTDPPSINSTRNTQIR
ncbi:MAG: hypothetical protein Q9226_007526 [Calogaya cf. arnoldii]